MRSAFFQIRDGKLTVTPPDCEERVTIENMNHLRSLLWAWAKLDPNAGYMVSSSIDFPEDETDDQTVIEMCRFLRPDGWTGAMAKAIEEGTV